MSSPASQTLPFKLTPPSAERCLPRPRLFAKLDGGARLVWIAAPAGSGKTSLVSSWLKARGASALWYHIDAGDAEPAAFFAYLSQAAGSLISNDAALPLLTPEYALGLPVFARNFFRRLWQTDCRLLILDDYHDLPADAALHAMLRHGLEETPTACRVVVVSRNEPPADWARMRLSGEVSLLGWQDLRLDDGECQALAASRLGSAMDGNLAALLNRRVGGWAAGLVLALEHGDIEGGNRLADDPLLFDFFAAEILAGLEAELPEFLMLCALLGEIRPHSAAELTGRADAENLLADLARRNLFTVYHRGSGCYEFHPLFREFLLTRATRHYSASRWRELTARAASILCAHGDFEAGIERFSAIEDWGAMADVLLVLAPTLHAAGRIAGLAAWLAALPEAELDRRPWLRYFQGACRLPIDPEDARRFYAMAFAGFDAEGDAAGCYSAWIAIGASFIFAFEGIAAADPWLAVLPVLRQRFSAFPNPELEAGVLTFSLFLPTLRHPDTPGLEGIAARLEDLTPSIRDPQLKVAAASNLLMYWLGVRGDNLRAERLAARFAADSLDQATPPLVRLMWETMHAFHHWLAADMAGLEQILRRALSFAETSGVRILDCYFKLQAVLIPAYAGDRKGAAEALAALLPHMAMPRSYDAYQYHFLRLLEARARRDAAAAIDAAKEVERYAARTEILSCALYALLAAVWRCQAEQDAAGALAAIDEAKVAAPGCGSVVAHWDVLFAELELAESLGDEKAMSAALAAFFAFGERYGLANCYGIHWQRPVLARFCAAALTRGLAVDYVEGLIRRHELSPERPPLHADGWPWPVRIQTLGGFEIRIDGKPLAFSASRVPVKPLELLKALIGFGCRDVDQEVLADALWPDADGDAAKRALHTNLHRLRGLLGEDSLSVRDGRVSLDPSRCWCDVAVVEAVATAGACGCADRSRCPLPASGEFLPRETDLPWLAEARKRIARLYVVATASCRWLEPKQSSLLDV